MIFMTISDENAQLWKGGKGMLTIIVWVSKFNESTSYIAKFLVICNVKVVVWDDTQFLLYWL